MEFKLSNFLDDNQHFHFSRNYLDKTSNIDYHTHDYYEVFWISEGNAGHFINGERVKISTGDLFFIHPKDAHTFLFNAVNDGIVIYNLAFPESVFNYIKHRYQDIITVNYWTVESNIRKLSLSQTTLFSLNTIGQKALKQERSIFWLDFLLIGLLQSLEPRYDTNNFGPAWLNLATERFLNSNLEHASVHTFVEYCNRTQSYINIIIKQLHNKTLTQYVNGLKIDWAVSQLLSTNDEIKEVAAKSGFNNLNYFYRTFKELKGMTPREFKDRNMKAYKNS
ncbi:helix-turn-helix domain-containing protein [Galbibacter sp. BG1]|uniref:helix-turn-helix domain-containing protein n=1 Tax=Galbibacter sp. BG1 TaxID=1170699 RepID=UPI0015BB8BD9|nr:helix-turn-helix domain-containing protein [Galbibacter sp. BG1]QLE01962.1 helix-turn-helix domain-containing protein [Galbibacter sp. BG1]